MFTKMKTFTNPSNFLVTIFLTKLKNMFYNVFKNLQLHLKHVAIVIKISKTFVICNVRKYINKIIFKVCKLKLLFSLNKYIIFEHFMILNEE